MRISNSYDSPYLDNSPDLHSITSAITATASGEIIAVGINYTQTGDSQSPYSVATNLFIKRFKPDLTLDTKFGTNGVALIAGQTQTPTAVSSLSDGRIQVTYADKTIFVTATGVLTT